MYSFIIEVVSISRLCSRLYLCYIVIYTFMQHHNDTTTKTNAWRTTPEERKQEDFFNIILTSHFIARVRKGCLRVACERVLETEHKLHILPHCYDRHVVSFLFSWCWGLLHRGVSRPPSVGCGFPYHIWSLLSGSLLATALAPNSTQLYNNSTPTRSPTGSLKSNV